MKSFSFCLSLLLCLPSFAGEICPLPSESNVSYASVLALPTRAPSRIVAYGDNELQFAQLWLPSVQPLPKSPVVALIHGGCWLNEYDIKHTNALSSALAGMGYAVWSLEYRRTGDQGGGWPGSLDDVIAGLNALSKQPLRALDLSKVAVIGHSAGGHLALLAAASERLELEAELVIGLAPIVNVSKYAQGKNSCQLATPKFMGGSPVEKPGHYEKANVQLGDIAASVVALHGDADVIVPLEQSSDLPQKVVPGAGHFDFIHPHTPAFQMLLKTLAEAL